MNIAHSYAKIISLFEEKVTKHANNGATNPHIDL